MSTFAPRIGVASWSIPKTLRQHEFPGATLLQHYALRFNAVEINSSFYKPHRQQTYQRWAATVPDSFRFAVKMPRSITHESALAGCEADLDVFLNAVSGLGEKLAVLLVQLPASLPYRVRLARPFFRALGEASGVRIACEPRHPSWTTAAATAIFEEFSIVRVTADPLPAGFPPASSESVDEFRYLRLHGSPRVYYSSYPAAYLAQLKGVLDRSRNGRQIWCIFDNTASGAAWSNACEINQA